MNTKLRYGGMYMSAKARPIRMDNKQIEQMLADTLVPVEPSPKFLRKLRARLVRYHGGQRFSWWMLIVVSASVILIGITLIGLLIRGISAWLGLLGGLGRRGGKPPEVQSVSV